MTWPVCWYMTLMFVLTLSIGMGNWFNVFDDGYAVYMITICLIGTIMDIYAHKRFPTQAD